jgi:cation transport ATPase
MMTPGTITTVLMIAGMRDNACRQKVAEAIESIAGVKDVNVNLYRARATIVHEPPCAQSMLMQTIEESGYAAEPVVERRRNDLADK